MALLELGTYRRWYSSDTSTDGDVTAAIADAQALADEETRRHLESAERTEQVRVDRNGNAYPMATPVTAVATDGWTVAGGGGWLTGAPLGGGYDIVTGRVGDTTTITYTGGYTAATCPQRLARALGTLAFDQLNASSGDGFAGSAAGAKAVSVGDVSVTYERASHRADGLPVSAMAAIRAFRRRL